MKATSSYTKMIIAYCCIAITMHTHAMENPQPTATHNPGISDGEKAFLEKRLPLVKATLEKMLKEELQDHQVPKIALIGSGGGSRAALCTTGSLCAAQKIGLLDCITYIPVLSGSTWAAGPWISTGKSIDEFKIYLQNCLAKGFLNLSLKETLLIAEDFAIKKANKQPITPVDLYGNILGNRFLEILKKNRLKAKLSDQAQIIENGSYPYPIYTAIDGRETIIKGQTWYGFTPHTVHDYTNNIHIPTETYGKKFKNGIIKNNSTPEKSLADIMGMCGSAFGANLYEILKELVSNNEVLQTISEYLPDSIEGQRPLQFYTEVANYMRDMDNLTDQTLAKEKNMLFVDAGLEMNLPYPPVSGICPERKADILIFLDASAGELGKEFSKVAEYAQKNNLPFPAINLKKINKKTISIFKDEHNPLAPVVIYMPRISDKKLWEQHKNNPDFAHYNLSGFDLDYQTNEGFCKTQNFQYEQEHSNLVMNQTEFNMMVNREAIIKEIKDWVNKR